MKRFYYDKQLNINEKYLIDGIEHNHIKNVMRMKVGDQIILVCGDEFDYFAEIINITKGDTEVRVFDKKLNNCNPKSNVTVFQALVKSDNMTLIVQKLTELGVMTFVPFESEFITSKDKFGKTTKLQDISNQSIKQCKRSMPMLVKNTIDFNELVNVLDDFDIVLFANECEKTQNLRDIKISTDSKVAIIIGSEGGFSPKEIDLLKEKAISVSLGNRILRAETASIALTSYVMCSLGEWDYV